MSRWWLAVVLAALVSGGLLGCGPALNDDDAADDDDLVDDDDAGDDDDAADDDDSAVLGCGVTDATLGPVAGDDEQVCRDGWPFSARLCDDLSPVTRTVHATGYGASGTVCGLGCDERNWATRVGDQTALDGVWSALGVGGPAPVVAETVFAREQVFLLLNDCSGGGDWLQPECVGVDPDGSLLIRTFWWNDGGTTTADDTVHVTVFSVPCSEWAGGDVVVVYGGAQ